MTSLIGTHQVVIHLVAPVPPGVDPQQMAKALLSGFSFALGVKDLVREVHVEVQQVVPKQPLVT